MSKHKCKVAWCRERGTVKFKPSADQMDTWKESRVANCHMTKTNLEDDAWKHSELYVQEVLTHLYSISFG